MAVFYDEPKKRNWAWLGWLSLLFIIIFVVNYPEWELRYKNSRVKTVSLPTKFNTKLYNVTKDENSVTGAFNGRIVQSTFSQERYTSGVSPDEMSIRFDQPVEIHGLLMSVDCWKSTRLVELAAGINQKPAYQANSKNNMLMHVSFATNNQAGKIDEHIWFPKPFVLTPQDSLNIGAWIQNVSRKKQTISPEIIVYYSWAPTPKPTWRRRRVSR